MKEMRAAVLILIILFAPLSCDSPASAHGVLRVAFLDIGQGDSIYIEAPNGNQLIIDGGPSEALSSALSEVVPFGDRTINTIMVTNPDSDHYSGFIELLKNFDVGAVIEPGTVTHTPTHAAFQKEITDKKIPELLARKGMTIDIDKESGVVFTVLFPDRDVSDWTTNDGSIEGILSYGSTKIFFTGDGSKKTESIVVSENSQAFLKSDILKVAHHGSRSSTSAELVGAVAPTYAVISDAKENKYGHPHKETLDNLTRANVKILRTDQLGTIIFTSDGTHFVQEK